MRRLADNRGPKLIVCLSLVLTTSGLAVAQATVQQHAAVCASSEAQRLGFLRGEWKVKSRFRFSRQPEQWEETQLRSTISYLFEDCLLVEVLKGKRQGHPFKATVMYGHNPNSNKYESVGADSEHGVLSLYTGSMSGNELVLELKIEISGESILLRRVLTKNPVGFEVRSQRSSDGGQTWDTTWHLVYSPK
jgi:hypothetical protein